MALTEAGKASARLARENRFMVAELRLGLSVCIQTNWSDRLKREDGFLLYGYQSDGSLVLHRITPFILRSQDVASRISSFSAASESALYVRIGGFNPEGGM